MAFYELLGLKETRRHDSEAGRFTLVFMAPEGQEDCPCLLYTSPSPRDQRGSRMPSSA